MNRKTLALALAAALSFNAFGVNIFNGNEKAYVVQALSADSLNKFNAMKFETLKTSVKHIDKHKVEVTLENIDSNSISSVNTTSFNHEVFTERNGLDNKAINVLGTWENNKLVVNGMTEPGIYTGDITINFKDNTRKVFRITLVKKPSDTITFTTNVSALKMDINDLKLNGKNFAPTSANISLNGGSSKNVVFNGQSGSATISLLDFGKLKEGDKFTLSVNYGKDGVYTATSEILLTKQAEPQILKATAANVPNLAQHIVDGIKVHGNENISTSDVKVEYNSQNSTGSIKVKNKEVLVYEQSTYGNNVGGGELKINNPVKSTFDVVVGEPKTILKNSLGAFENKQGNFLPVVGVDYGSDGQTQSKLNDVGLIGDYKFEIDGKTSVFFDANKAKDGTKLKADLNVDRNSAKVVYKLGQNNDGLYKNAVLNDQNKITVDLSNKVQHGYGSVPVNFTVDFKEDENSIFEANKKVREAQVPGNKVEAVIQTRHKDGANSTDPVKTSVILVSDALDAISLNASFEKLTSSTGNIIISGNGLKYDINSTLRIPGANAQLDTGASKDGKLVFRVAFNSDINAQDTTWNLTTSGKNLSGKVDLTFGVVESVNVNSRFENNPNTTDTFKVSTDFMKSYINDGIKSFIGINGNEINPEGIRFIDLSLTSGNTLRSIVTKGKYQGKYEAGVWIGNQLMTIITKGESTTPGTVNLTIDANFVNKDDYKNITGARIEYREKATENREWITAGIVFKLPDNSNTNNSDIKEEPITKTISGLVSGREYEFRVRYTYNNKGIDNFIYSNISTVRVYNANSTGDAVVIPVNPSNSNYDFDTTHIVVPQEINYGANKTTKISSISYKNRRGDIVVEPRHDYSNVTIKFENNRIVIDGLVPGKPYEEITFSYVDNKGLSKNVIVKNPKTEATKGSAPEYLANVYNVSLGRPADEAGYHFHLSRLVNKQTTLRAFLLNMLSEKEFIELYITPETKIEALYNAIVARPSDEGGKRFWINEYKKMLPVYGSQEATLKAISNRMVNEPELRELAGKLGLEI